MKSLFLFLLIPSVFAADLQKVNADLQKELKEANSALNKQRSESFAERQKVRQAILAKQQEFESEKKSSEGLNQEIENLAKEVQELERSSKSAEKTLNKLKKFSLQVRREAEAAIPSPLIQLHSEFFAEQDQALESDSWDSSFEKQFSHSSKLLEEGLKVQSYEIEAINSAGNKEKATATLLSYAQMFLSFPNEAGYLQTSEDHNTPTLTALPVLLNELKGINSGSETQLTFDFTNGMALKEAAKAKTIIEHFKAGGVIIYPLLFLGIICLLAGLYKTLQLYTMKSQFDDKVRELVRLISTEDKEAAEAFIAKQKNPIQSLLKEAYAHHNTPRENLEELLNETILTQLPVLDRLLTVLSVSAGAAPLLGLLGTVMGIIKTFEMISVYGTGDANRLAGGISEALVTTEMGLIVAIPALIWHAVLNRRLKTIVGNLEKAMLSFINAISIKEAGK